MAIQKEKKPYVVPCIGIIKMVTDGVILGDSAGTAFHGEENTTPEEGISLGKETIFDVVFDDEEDDEEAEY